MRRTTVVLLALLIAFAAAAQNSVRVEAPGVVAADEQFNVTFVIEGENAPSVFEWEPGDDFQLVWGPQKGTSTSVSIVNGKRTRSSQTTYTYVLIPKRTGSLSIPEARATVKGQTIRSSRTSVNVVTDSSSSSSQSQSGSSSSSSRAAGDISSDDLFLRLSLSRSNVVVGEPLTATLKLYQRVNIAGFEDVRFPSFNGFWSQELQAPSNIEFKRESLGDRIYNSAVLRSWTLIPQQAGDISIDPAELVCLVNVRVSSSGSNSIFDSFFQDDYRTIRKRITSGSYKVHVSRLPDGAPASFGGGVGKFDIKASVSRDSLKAHDAASLVVTISGNGNISLLEAPKVNFPPDFEVYDTKVKESGGSKVFEFPFIPRSHGDFTIPPVEYSYYDVSAGRYVTLSTAPIDIKVGRGNEAESASVSSVPSGTIRKDVRSLGSDIRYISTRTPSLGRKDSFFVGSALFVVLAVVIALLAAAAWFVLGKMERRRADVAGVKNRKAAKMARKRLAQADEYLKNGLTGAYYEELHRALLGFISDKLNINLSEMSKENIAESLVAAGVSESLAASFNELLDACEYARYSPEAGEESMTTHFDAAVSVISSIDSSMKAKKTGVAKVGVMAALLLMLSPVGLSAAQDPYLDSLWTRGVDAYAGGLWSDACSAWTSLNELGLESAELYYNTGNAYFKENDWSHAILYYERALKLDPSFDDARFNLEFAQSFIQDRIDEVPEFFFKQWRRNLCHLLPSDTWAVLFLILFAATLAMLVLFLRGSGSARKTGFFVGIVLLLLSLFALDFATMQRRDYRDSDGAIVMRPVTSVKSSPASQTAKDLFVLHEGTKVRVLDRVGDWCNITLSDGRQGWIPESDIEII